MKRDVKNLSSRRIRSPTKKKFSGNRRQYKRHFYELVRMYSILPRLQTKRFYKARKTNNKWKNKQQLLAK